MMLEQEDQQLIRWDTDGTAFIIPDLKAVEDTILPRYFRGKHFSSFQRQMNYFGFHKRKLANGHCSFCHSSFHREFPEKLILIKRKGNEEGAEGDNYPGSTSPVELGYEGSEGRHVSCDPSDAVNSLVGKPKGSWEGGLLEELGLVNGVGALRKHTEVAQRWTNGEYTGQWQGDKRHGKGVMVWDDGDTYEGEFMFDKRHGRGKYTYTSGNVYEGMWADDKKHGEGVFVWTSGSTYTGCYRHDKKNGKGLMVRSNGVRQEGTFENDRFCQPGGGSDPYNPECESCSLKFYSASGRSKLCLDCRGAPNHQQLRPIKSAVVPASLSQRLAGAGTRASTRASKRVVESETTRVVEGRRRVTWGPTQKRPLEASEAEVVFNAAMPLVGGQVTMAKVEAVLEAVGVDKEQASADFQDMQWLDLRSPPSKRHCAKRDAAGCSAATVQSWRDGQPLSPASADLPWASDWVNVCSTMLHA
jgi:hypothetical protein